MDQWALGFVEPLLDRVRYPSSQKNIFAVRVKN